MDKYHGLVPRAIAVAAGIPDDALGHRRRTGALRRVAHGICTPGQLSREGRLLAAALQGGEGSFVSGLWVAEVRRISRFRPGVIDVVTPHRCQLRPGLRFLQCSTLVPTDLVVLDEVPFASTARMLVDLAYWMTAHEVCNLIHQAAFRGLYDRAATIACAERNKHRNGDGYRTIMRAIKLHDDGCPGTRSGLEDWYLTKVIEWGLPEPVINGRVAIAGGSLEVDVNWEPRVLCVELDGTRGHSRQYNRREDAERGAALVAAGWRVLRITSRDAWHRPAWVREQTLRAYAGGNA